MIAISRVSSIKRDKITITLTRSNSRIQCSNVKYLPIMFKAMRNLYLVDHDGDKSVTIISLIHRIIM